MVAIAITVVDRTVVSLVVDSDVEVEGRGVEVDATAVDVVVVEVGYVVVFSVAIE